MKKLLSLITIITLLCSVLVFSGCGKETTTADNSKTDTDKSGSIVKDTSLPVFKTDTTITETVIYDKEGVKITANSIEFMNEQLCVNFTFENGSSKTLRFVSGSVGYSCNSVNKCMIEDGYINCEVTAGAKAVEEMNIDIIELQMFGITEVAEIEVGFEISDDDYNDTYTGPLSIKTSATGYDSSEISFVNSIQNKELQDEYKYSVEYIGEEKLFDNASVSVNTECLATNSDEERLLFLELNNASDSQLYFVSQKISVNGIKIYEGNWSAVTLNAGSKAIETISIDDIVDKEILEKYGIKDINSITVYGSVEDFKDNTLVKPTEINIAVTSKESKADISGAEVYNSNDIKIISKGFYMSDDDYEDEIHLLLLVQNSSANEIAIESEYNTLTLNTVMVDNTTERCKLAPSSFAVLDLEIQSYDYEDAGITGVSDITTATLTLNIETSNGKKIDSPKITVNA